MAGTAKKWLAGCGIGCGLIILLNIVIGAGGYYFIKNGINKIEAVGETQDELEDRLGMVDEYVPPTDGSLYSDRIETFLYIREEIQPAQKELVDMFDQIPESRSGNIGPIKAIKIFQAVAKIVPHFGEYLQHRNELLLDANMSIGEYFYIHALAYNLYLGNSPGDGPESQYGSGRGSSHRGGRVQFFDEDDTFSRQQSIRRFHRTFRTLLQNQFDALPQPAADSRDQDAVEWYALLSAEITKLRNERYEIPWSDGLPDVIVESLVPYREDFERTYCPLTNSIDVFTSDDDNWHRERQHDDWRDDEWRDER